MNLPRTIEWLDGRVRLINQLKLPHTLEYVETDDWRRIAKAIENMEIRGAPAIGVAAGYALALAALSYGGEDAEEFKGFLDNVASALLKTRPTAVNLSWAVKRIRRRVAKLVDVDEIRRAVLEEAEDIRREDEESNKRIGDLGERLIEDGDTVITICNAGSLATSYYGTATAPIYRSVERGKEVRVIVLETRPYLQGARLTAWELSRAGIDVRVVTDNSMGIVVQKEDVRIALVGADRVTRLGYVANKVGTYPLALVCFDNRIPLYVAAPTSTLDHEISWPEEIEIERRSEKEVLYIYGHRIAPMGVRGLYYAFDITPPKYITGIITERGIAYPPYERSLRRFKNKP